MVARQLLLTDDRSVVTNKHTSVRSDISKQASRREYDEQLYEPEHSHPKPAGS